MNIPLRSRAAFIVSLLIFLPLLVNLVRSDEPTPTPPNRLLSALRANRPMQALYQIETMATQTGWPPELAREAGDLWQQVGDLPRAVDFWEVTAKTQTADAGLLKQLAQANLDLQRWSDASAALARLVTLTPDDNWAHYHLGILQAAFSPAQAAEQFQFAAREPVYRPLASDFSFLSEGNPDDPVFVMKVGVTLASRNLWGDAERSFLYAASLERTLADALAYAGLARDRQGKNGSDQIEQAVALAPYNAQVRYLQGLHLRQKGDEAASRDALLQAASIDPLNPAYAAELGSAYQLENNLAQAEYWLKQAVKLSNNDPRFQDLLDQFYAQIPASAG